MYCYMITFLIYILKSSFCILLLYAIYKLLLSSTTHFRFNRFVVIAGTAVSMFLPFVSLEIEKDISAPVSFYMLEEMAMPDYSRDIADIKNNIPNNQASTDPNLIINILKILYLAGTMVMLLSLLTSYVRVINLIKGMDCVKYNGVKWMLTRKDIRPFSFWNHIIISYADYNRFSPICIHEMEHITNKHYYDDLFLQIVLIFHWFNPSVWLLRKELKTLHEYQADYGVLKSGINATKYQLLLVEKAVGSRLYSMARGFSHNSLKKRIIMMLKKKDSKWTRLRILPAVPIVAGVLYVFATPEIKSLSSFDNAYVKDSVQADYSDNLLSELNSNGDYTVVDLYVNKRNQYLLNRDIALKEIDETTTTKIKEILVSKFVEEYNSKKENCHPVVICIKADRDTKMEAVNEIKRNVRSAYSLANTELKKEYPSDIIDKCMQPKLFYTYPKVTTDNPARINNDKVVLNGYEIKFSINGEEEIMKLSDFSVTDLKKAINSISKSYDIKKLTISLKCPSDTSEGTVYDLKQVLRSAYLQRLYLE